MGGGDSMLKVLNSNNNLDNDALIVSFEVCVSELIEESVECGSNDICTQSCDGICKPWVR